MSTTETAVFSVYDWIVFALVLGVSAGIGIYYAVMGGRQKTTKEYLLADKSMGYFPVAMSLLASLFTGIYVQVGVDSGMFGVDIRGPPATSLRPSVHENIKKVENHYEKCIQISTNMHCIG